MANDENGNRFLQIIRFVTGAQAGPPPQAGYSSNLNWNIQQNGSAPPPTAAAGYASQGAPYPAAHQGNERMTFFLCSIVEKLFLLDNSYSIYLCYMNRFIKSKLRHSIGKLFGVTILKNQDIHS